MDKVFLDTFISTQIIGEFYVSLTRSCGGIDSPLTPEEAKKEIEKGRSCPLIKLW